MAMVIIVNSIELFGAVFLTFAFLFLLVLSLSAAVLNSYQVKVYANH